ncbi:U4/U6 x U5 tri-snRNP complex subunit Prp1 [Coemansia javaensis]|uniref:U4/U6 x U5 tri-snRNP complex subunit Prp1 n=1 Tax=Coemansia javaensis TaxID=2761396 RepID=A0A9W8HKR3_9FUNG|nr:U4/U6 x U5 tri-snRNP complex subunit Prp1 [Coemansia javaensis]
MYPVTKDFLGKPAPPGYVAGLGRGASGFTTRSDIGPAREGATGGKEGSKRGRADDDNDDGNSGRFANAENEEGLFSGMAYEQDDEEADQVWAMIDAKMERRRQQRQQQRRRAKGAEEEGARADEGEDPELRGLKRQLQGLSEAEWGAIPEVSQVAESAARAKRRRKAAVGRRGERFAQVSDSTMVAGLGLAGHDREIGTETEAGAMTDLVALGQARDDVLRLRLDQAGDSASGKTTVDPRGYLTSLNTVAVQNAADIGDIARARTLLRSVVQTNPKHAAGWIAAARLEEVAKKPARARALIAQACDNCPQSEDVWLEAARLNPRDTARAVLASAARSLPRSVRVWTCAAELEARAGDTAAQRRVLRRALEFVPTSVALWKAAVALEPPDDARVLLAHAVELVPLSVDLWLALARLETYDKAQRVLNRARRAVPTSHEVWIAAARLEESQGRAEAHHQTGAATTSLGPIKGQDQDQDQNQEGTEKSLKLAEGSLKQAEQIESQYHARVLRVMTKAVASLANSGAALDRDAWLAQAQQCERDGYVATCRAIVAASGAVGFDAGDSDAERSAAWAAEAERLVPGSLETARALLALAVEAQPGRAELWRAAADLERAHGPAAAAEAVLRRAVQYCPQEEVLWLMAAKDKWARQGDVAGARVILEEAFAANPASEAIMLAAVKLEAESGQPARALKLLERARSDRGFGARVWIKSAALLRQLGRADDALAVAAQGTARFPQAHKLWLIQAQLEPAATARQTLSRALRACPAEPVLWTSAAALEAGASVPRARAILERARVHIPREPQLWLAAVRLEARHSADAARALLARALQECPRAGALWAEAIVLEPRPQRKARSVDAMKNTDAGDPFVATAVARLFWSERRPEKARTWFARATAADPDFGDAWAWWLRFEAEQPPPDDASDHVARVEAACAAAAPCHGQHWPPIAKDPANARLSTVEVLRLVAAHLGTAAAAPQL